MLPEDIPIGMCRDGNREQGTNIPCHTQSAEIGWQKHIYERNNHK